MATEFIKKTETVKKMVEIETTTTVNTGINLELTLEEAYLLAEIGSQVAGDMDFSPRKHFTHILSKLEKLNIHWKYGSCGRPDGYNRIFDKKTYINFTNDALKLIQKEAQELAHQK